MCRLPQGGINIIIERLTAQEIDKVQRGHSQCFSRNERREEMRLNREKALLTFSITDVISATSLKNEKWHCKEPVTPENCRSVSSHQSWPSM